MDQASSGIDIEALGEALEDPSQASSYVRGVTDLLRLLGLLRDEDGRAAPADEVAGMVLDSLRAHLRDGVTVGLAWGDLDGEGLRGVDILRAIEAARLARVAEPTPGRVVRVAQAVIKARRDGEEVYLMQYDRHAGQYQPIGGKQKPEDADSAAALRREIAEELGLDGPPGVEACTLRLLKAGWGAIRQSATYGILTRYTFDFYHVEKMGFPVKTGQDTRWLSRAEMVAGRAEDGRAISSVYAEALDQAMLDGLSPVV